MVKRLEPLEAVAQPPLVVGVLLDFAVFVLGPRHEPTRCP